MLDQMNGSNPNVLFAENGDTFLPGTGGIPR